MPDIPCQEDALPLIRIDMMAGRSGAEITQNTDEDWSFGHGRAQFLTGELRSKSVA
jgi:hypothetical protein